MASENMELRVFLVTGGTGAIGKAIARQLAMTPYHEVVLVGRDETRTRKATQDLIQATGNEQLRYEIADLSRRATIQDLAERWQGPLHVLINNAAASPRSRQETPEGIELQFATNVLGYYWMIQNFEDILSQSSPSQVVNVASYWAGDLDLDDLEFKRRRYNNNRAYRQSKQADRMLTAAFASQLKSRGIAINACHPGDVNSKLSNDLGFGGSETPDQGADTPVWLVTQQIDDQRTGLYFENRREVLDRFVLDGNAVEALYQACAAYDGL